MHKVSYKNKNYAVIPIQYKDIELPTIIDFQDYKFFKKAEKQWRTNKKGLVYCRCRDSETNKAFNYFLHD